jgi:hypothetical protein
MEFQGENHSVAALHHAFELQSEEFGYYYYYYLFQDLLACSTPFPKAQESGQICACACILIATLLLIEIFKSYNKNNGS